MLKILPVEEVRKADAYTIQNEPIVSIDLMERAAGKCAEWIMLHASKKEQICVVCGLGNNGGDGLAIARMLAKKKYKVQVFILRYSNKSSEDFESNLHRLRQMGQVAISELHNSQDFFLPQETELIVDAIFGSGLSKPVSGFAGEIIEKVNAANSIRVSIDSPSGLFADKCSVKEKGAIIKADYTLSFQFPKLAFLFPENDVYVGRWQVLPIGLSEKFIQKIEVKNFMIDLEACRKLYKVRPKFAHKGYFGHALLLSGSTGKMGAAVLAAKACLRSGTGLLSVHVPSRANCIMQSSVPEAMLSLDEAENHISMLPDLSKFNAIGAGPGISMENETQQALKLLIQNSTVPLLFDADAINILGENKTWLSFLPPKTILTPHPKEFERIAGKSADDFERNRLQKELSFKYQIYIVLKGAHTVISTPEGECYFNTSGNPGMAGAGSGDVLCGMILALLAQQYTPLQACILGVFLHGLAGDKAARKKGFEAMTAGDIVNKLGKAFKKLYSQKFR